MIGLGFDIGISELVLLLEDEKRSVGFSKYIYVICGIGLIVLFMPFASINWSRTRLI